MIQSKQSEEGVLGALRARPAVAVVILLATGMGLRDVIGCRPWVWVICIFVLLGVGAVLRLRSWAADLAIGAATILLGLLAAQIEFYQFPSDHIWSYTSDAERFAQVELEIAESPRIIPAAAGDPRMLEPKQTVRAEVRSICSSEGWTPASGTVLLTLEQLNPNLAAGEIVRVTGRLERPGRAMNPGEFDYYSWERQQRVLATMLVSHADGVQIDSDPGPGAIVWMREKARHLLAQGFTLDRSYDHVLLRAFVLGDSDPQLEDLEEQFVNTGIVHFLSVSGLHVAIAGGFVLFLGRVLRASPRASLIAALIGVALYGIVATPTWPGWRSILMFGAFGAGVMFRRRPDSIQLFAAAVGAILLIHPGDISNGGFQISFAAVLGMMFFTTRAMKWAQAKWRGPDAVALRPPRRGTWREGLVWVGRFFVSALFASSIAWLMVIPLIAYHYGQLNTYSALAGVVFLPVTVLALIFGLGKIVLTFCWPGLAHFWAVGCVIPVVWLRDMAAGLAKIPGATIPLPTPSVGLLVVYYALVLVALFRWKSWVRRAAPVAAVGLLFLWPLVAGRASSSRGEIRITLISLGNGQCAVVRAADGHAVLIDCGSSTVADLRRRLITPYLRAEGCSKVDEVFLSHAAFDRLSGAGDVFANYDEPAFFTNPQFAREAMGDVPGEELLEKLLDADRMPRILHRGDRLQLADGVTVDVLWPPADCGLNSNNCSLVLKLGYAGRSVIFPGDVQDAAQRELLANPHELKCDVLVAPYHGSAGTTTARFLRAAGAQMILASNSSKPTHKEKIFDSMAGDAAVYRTSRCGAITVTIGAGGRISVETFISGR